ncbi:unnamed protein product, partial [Iphiclides podalirius]
MKIGDGVVDPCAQYYSERISSHTRKRAIYSRGGGASERDDKRRRAAVLAQWDEAAAAVHPGRFSVLIPHEPPPTLENCIFFDAPRFSRSN